MKLITILFLCSRLLPSLTQDSSQEIDCNDPDVFQAADTALKKYNSGNKSGNQFVLYRVTEVIRTDDPDTFYSFKYQIKEGNCPVQSDKTWQDCDYNDSAQAATGECTATVAKRGNMKFSVATQTCQITPAEGPLVTAQYDCLGCLHPISTESPDLEPVLRHAIQHFNNNTDHSHLFDLKEVKKAQRQNIGECTDKAYVDIQLRIASFSQKCDLYPGEDFVQPPTRICAGCPISIPVNSPELEEPLEHSIAKLNVENNGTFYFKIDTVEKATVQVVAGKKYSIVFTARETTCSKESNEELTKSCEINKHSLILNCKADVYVVPWEKKIYPTVNCQSLGQTTLMKRPPGFSPFRSVPVEKTKEGTIRHVKSCEYKGRPQETGAEPASESEVN
nr:kininogen-1 isoform X3 [Globicephala melas]